MLKIGSVQIWNPYTIKRGDLALLCIQSVTYTETQATVVKVLCVVCGNKNSLQIL